MTAPGVQDPKERCGAQRFHRKCLQAWSHWGSCSKCGGQRPGEVTNYAGIVQSVAARRFRFRNIQQMPNHCGRRRTICTEDQTYPSTHGVIRPCEPKDAKEAGACHSKCAALANNSHGTVHVATVRPGPEGKSTVLCLDLLVNASAQRHGVSSCAILLPWPRSESCDKCGTTSMTRNRVGI